MLMYMCTYDHKCVLMHIFVYLCTSVIICAYMCIPMSTCDPVCVYLYTHAECVYIAMHVYSHEHLRMSVHTCEHTCAQLWSYILMNICVYS